MKVKEPRSLVRQLLVDKALSATNGEKESNPLGASRSLRCLSTCSTSDVYESSDGDALEDWQQDLRPSSPKVCGVRMYVGRDGCSQR